MPMQISISNAIGGDGGAQGSGNRPSFASTNSFTFDGSTDYIDCGNPSSLQITNTITLSAWIKTTDTSSYEIIIGKDSVGTGTRSFLLYRSGSVARFGVYKSNAGQFISATTTINDGNWHHIMGVNDGTDLKIYVNGTPEGTSIGNGGAFDNGTNTFYIGRRGGSPSQRAYFTGNIDEVAVWNSDESANASTIYNSGVPNDISSLNPVSWWRMGEAANYTSKEWVLTDQGSGGNDGFSNTLPQPPAQPSTDVPS